MKALNFILAVALFFVAINLNAQERIIQGRVFTFDSIPVIGAEVFVKSTKQVVKTDTTGRFTVSCKKEDQMKVSAKGFTTAKFKVNEKSKIAIVNLKLKPGTKNREIAIGYGYVREADRLNAMASLNNGDVDFSMYSNIYDLIRGRFSGVQVVNGEIIIRGIKSINRSNAALIVVDGVPSSSSILGSIPPSQIRSINILKDSSAAIYGSRGANGVVLIETKKGNNL